MFYEIYWSQHLQISFLDRNLSSVSANLSLRTNQLPSRILYDIRLIYPWNLIWSAAITNIFIWSRRKKNNNVISTQLILCTNTCCWAAFVIVLVLERVPCLHWVLINCLKHLLKHVLNLHLSYLAQQITGQNGKFKIWITRNKVTFSARKHRFEYSWRDFCESYSFYTYMISKA